MKYKTDIFTVSVKKYQFDIFTPSEFNFLPHIDVF
jgi:hypothetical protein